MVIQIEQIDLQITLMKKKKKKTFGLTGFFLFLMLVVCSPVLAVVEQGILFTCKLFGYFQ